MGDEAGAAQPVRIDKWLWAARLAKTRPLAAEAVKGGHVEVNGRRVAPGRRIAVGDRLELTIGDVPRVVIVRGTAERREPASVAATLYEETPDSVAERERLAQQRRLAAAAGDGFAAGAGGGPRPTKRERRRLDAATTRSSSLSNGPARRTRRGRR
jgi:ribosome-associated heat shock protein Hsp15